MSLFDRVFGKAAKQQAIEEYFKLLTAYQPAYTSFGGGLYEMERTRAAIHTFAMHASKLKPEVTGKNNQALARMLQFKPNPWMDTTKFLYKIATVLMVQNNCIIVPLLDQYDRVVGYYPLSEEKIEVVENSRGGLMLRYTTASGRKAAMDFDRCGIVNRHFYKDDFFGENNTALSSTMEMINAQNQGVVNGIASSGSVRFLAKLGQTLKDKDITAERNRFVSENLSNTNGGVMMIDQKYTDVKQIESKPFLVDDKQMSLINENVDTYFNINNDILQSKYSEDTFNAFYEGPIESFALQLGLVLTNMTFTDKELSFGNEIMLSSNRLQYASNTTKLNVSSNMFDRGILNRDEIREIWQLPVLPNGEGKKYFIRLEYVETDKINQVQGTEEESNANQE